ncbi:hypothetical protein BJ742DRAFT_69501 [Cladochytrium replicatum]|nr:hypothetical protein BJ742DRAFT_69501 [Cladochytrium replicatum]
MTTTFSLHHRFIFVVLCGFVVFQDVGAQLSFVGCYNLNEITPPSGVRILQANTFATCFSACQVDRTLFCGFTNGQNSLFSLPRCFGFDANSVGELTSLLGSPVGNSDCSNLCLGTNIRVCPNSATRAGLFRLDARVTTSTTTSTTTTTTITSVSDTTSSSITTTTTTRTTTTGRSSVRPTTSTILAKQSPSPSGTPSNGVNADGSAPASTTNFLGVGVGIGLGALVLLFTAGLAVYTLRRPRGFVSGHARGQNKRVEIDLSNRFDTWTKSLQRNRFQNPFGSTPVPFFSMDRTKPRERYGAAPMGYGGTYMKGQGNAAHPYNPVQDAAPTWEPPTNSRASISTEHWRAQFSMPPPGIQQPIVNFTPPAPNLSAREAVQSQYFDPVPPPNRIVHSVIYAAEDMLPPVVPPPNAALPPPPPNGSLSRPAKSPSASFTSAPNFPSLSRGANPSETQPRQP